MIKILFICHGNICRSPMAEFVMKDLVKREKLNADFFIASAATSREEIGNPVHPGTQNKLAGLGISAVGKYAVHLECNDYKHYDYIVGMDARNMKNMLRILGEDREEKCSLLLDYTKAPGDIADPWYTGDFDKTYEDIKEGCAGLLKHMKESRMAETISRETLEQVARLAQLELTEAEKEQAKQDMSQMLEYMEILKELDTSQTEPMSHVFPIENVFRKDEERQTGNRADMLQNAPQIKDGCYQVPKTV